MQCKKKPLNARKDVPFRSSKKKKSLKRPAVNKIRERISFI